LKHKEQALTADQVSRLLGSPNVNTPDGKRDKAILALMTMHGLEVNEVHKLNLDNIQLDQGKAGVIHVVGRGDKKRDIALSTKSSDLLQAWLEERRRWLNEEDPHRDDGPVFVAMHSGTRGKSGQGVSERGIRGIVDGYLEAVEAKREGISCHALRHNYIVLSLQGGSGSLQELIESIEHGSVSTTCFYPT
jgi:integrase/recombinase XerD